MNLIALCIVGLGIGVLAGLSVSPVLSIILTSLIVAAATANAVLSDFLSKSSAPSEDSAPAEKRTPSTWPLAVLVVGIVLGSLSGVWARTTYSVTLLDQASDKIEYAPNENIAIAVEEWVALGIPRELVVSRVFDAHFGSESVKSEAISQTLASSTTAALFSVGSNDCATLISAAQSGDDKLRTAFASSSSDELYQLADALEDNYLHLLLKFTCREESQ